MDMSNSITDTQVFLECNSVLKTAPVMNAFS